MITPNEIENSNLKKPEKGIRRDEVDDFLDQLTVDYEKLYRANREQTEQIQTLTKAVEYYQNMENALNNALVMAEKTAEERKLAAQKAAEQIEKNAEQRGDAILADAKNRIFGLHQEISRLELQLKRRGHGCGCCFRQSCRSGPFELEPDLEEHSDKEGSD